MNSTVKVISYALLSISLVACNGLGKMTKNFGTVKNEVTPNPLEMHGDTVAISIKGTFPPKYFAKKVDLVATPYIKSSTGNHEFKSVTNVGEKSLTNGNKINMKAGGSFTYSDRMAYTEDMRGSDVMIKVMGTKGKKTQEVGNVKIADATIVTPLLVQHDEKVISAKDNFVRIVPASYEANMYYLINTSRVNPNFKVKECGISNKTEFALLDSATKALMVAPYVLKGMAVMGNASPDGTEKLNADLAADRAEASVKHIAGMFKKMKIKMPVDSSFFSTSTTNEDWAGFQRLMQESSMPQKDMILRIVASNTDSDAREIEIKKMGKAYTEIAEGVLPKLRRSVITINADKVGRSDEEILATARTSPDSLSLEEILRAGSLVDNNIEKLGTYRIAERNYPQDWRCANNVGVCLFANNDIEGAMAEFQKADQLNAGNPMVKNNMGACYSRMGDRKNAAMAYAAAAGAGPEVKRNSAILDIRNGNYSMALSNLSGANSFNESLAKLLSGDKDGAMSTISASPDGNSAMGAYLKAVISARKGDASGVLSNLKTATDKDSSLKAMAASDREFLKWYNDSSFQALVK